MKKLSQVLLILLSLLLVLAVSDVTGVNAEAKSKKKKTQVVLSEDEVNLNELIAYRDSLVKAGASQEDINFANQAINALKIKIENDKAAKAALEQQQKAQQEYLASMADIEKTLQKGLKRSTAGVVFIGDSRFVQMHEAVGETGVSYIAAGWMGYDWLVDTAIPRVDPYAVKGTKIVINLGVNDLENIDKYIATVNQKAAEWTAKGATVYYATVNPVEGNNYGVDNFNNKLINGLRGVKIINTNAFLKTYGCQMADNVHYKGPTSLNIYCYIMSQL